MSRLQNIDLNVQTITELHRMHRMMGKMVDDGIANGRDALVKAANLVRRDIVFHIESLEDEAVNILRRDIVSNNTESLKKEAAN